MLRAMIGKSWVVLLAGLILCATVSPIAEAGEMKRGETSREKRAEPKPRPAVGEAWASLPVPRIGVRQEDLHPKYSQIFTFVWAHVPEIPGSVLDLLCYEWSNLEYLGHRKLEKAAIELRHRSRDDSNVLLITTVTPEPGAVEFVARAEVDKERAPQGKLPDKLPEPNLCFRVKRAEGCFSHFPDPFPEFISRCFIFADKGRTFLTDTVRQKNAAAAADDPRNNPPWIQIYVGVWRPQPRLRSGKTWYNASPDRFTIPIMGVVSRDGKYLTAIANGSPERGRITQAWQQCLHNNPIWTPKDAPPAERQWRVKIYIMPNDPELLLERVGKDFPNAPKLKENRIPARSSG